ncbi:MAG TPA: ABC transporter permease [Thermoanaerobaculia bacterium]|nr:ABC transporter permease [Thermoanaerobaculia bacterium]
MLLTEVFRVAMEAIRANKLRSFLTALGIIIGIAAVITMVALGEGAQRSVQERLQGLGTNVLTVRPGQEFMGGVDRGEARLTGEDARALLREPRAILRVSPEMQRRLQVEIGTANANIQVVGIWPSYLDIQNHMVAEGRMFTDAEERGRRRVAVLGAMVGQTLGTTSEALVGETIRIRGIPFEVVGVLAEKGQVGFGSPDENLYIPLATAQFRVFGTDRVQTVHVQAVGEREVDAAIAEIDTVLRREHRLRPAQTSDFTIRNQATLLETFQATTRTFSFLLAGIALVSLLVGGIGIMNIMLVSVTERTREIGVRKALGARRRDILLQFLIEALVLCLAGGAIGILTGLGGAMTLQRLAGWNTAVSPEAVIVAFLFSAAVGVFFGLWPARRAASLDPIEALRYE